MKPELFTPAEIEAMRTAVTPPDPRASLRDLYKERVACCYDSVAARRRFAEYDQFRSIWLDELWHWLFGDNPRAVHTLTAFAWRVQHERMSEGGTMAICLRWSQRNQRLYLGDGLLEYLGILKDEIERVYEIRDEASVSASD